MSHEDAMNHEDAVRKRIVIDGENFYITMGKRFVTATISHENRSENEKTRRVVDSICDAITEILIEAQEKNENNT